MKKSFKFETDSWNSPHFFNLAAFFCFGLHVCTWASLESVYDNKHDNQILLVISCVLLFFGSGAFTFYIIDLAKAASSVLYFRIICNILAAVLYYIVLYRNTINEISTQECIKAKVCAWICRGLAVFTISTFDFLLISQETSAIKCANFTVLLFWLFLSLDWFFTGYHELQWYSGSNQSFQDIGNFEIAAGVFVLLGCIFYLLFIKIEYKKFAHAHMMLSSIGLILHTCSFTHKYSLQHATYKIDNKAITHTLLQELLWNSFFTITVCFVIGFDFYFLPNQPRIFEDTKKNPLIKDFKVFAYDDSAEDSGSPSPPKRDSYSPPKKIRIRIPNRSALAFVKLKRLQTLETMRNRGHLTKHEYDKQKQRILIVDRQVSSTPQGRIDWFSQSQIAQNSTFF